MLLVERLMAPAMHGRGAMPLPQIYKAVKARARQERVRLSPRWQATVRNTLQRHCRQHPKFVGPPPYFVHHDRGIWELRQWRNRYD